MQVMPTYIAEPEYYTAKNTYTYFISNQNPWRHRAEPYASKASATEKTGNARREKSCNF
jgi:hypothetical protein